MLHGWPNLLHVQVIWVSVLHVSQVLLDVQRGALCATGGTLHGRPDLLDVQVIWVSVLHVGPGSFDVQRVSPLRYTLHGCHIEEAKLFLYWTPTKGIKYLPFK